ncbi:MAG: glutathione synthase [Pseudomonadota bacterium]
MGLTVACQMDDVAGIDVAGDSTFALLLEAQRRGHRLLHYTPERLSYAAGALTCVVSDMKVEDAGAAPIQLSSVRPIDLRDVDVVLLRQDPPFDMAYITSTHLLERIHPATLVVNDPSEVRNAPEKLFVLDFPDLMPPTLVTRQLDDVRAFQRSYRDIIVKPLYGNGGAGVFRIKADDSNLSSLIELFQQTYREPFVVQEFRAEVSAGDKRIILVDGALAGVVNRVPPAGETRSNLHVGGRAELVDLTDRDREICERIGPELKQRGLLFTGIDVIGSFLTEINVTSPTGLRHISALGGPDLSVQIWDAIEAKFAETR